MTGVGILAGSVLAFSWGLSGPADIALEYVLGFGFGWTVFQALFLRSMVGGSYVVSLKKTFLAEFLSMNALMAAMLPVAALARLAIGATPSPRTPEFWFIMSMALLAGFISAYPMNWWLVSRGLKHGMMTVRPRPIATEEPMPTGMPMPMPMPMPMAGPAEHRAPRVTSALLARMTFLSVGLLAIGVGIAVRLDMH